MTKAIIVNLDGSLTNYDHRKENEDIYEDLHRDKCQQWCKELIDAFFGRSIQIIIISTRPERCRKQTQDWLLRHGIRYHKLFMSFDDREDEKEIKKYIFEKQIKNSYQIVLVVEAGMALIELWKKLGVNCLGN